MRKLFAGNGNPPPKDKPMRQPEVPLDDNQENTPADAGNGNPPPPDKP